MTVGRAGKMRYKIERYSDLENALALAQKRTEKYENRIRKDIKGIKSSFAPLKLVGDAMGFVSLSLVKNCLRKKK